MRQVLLLIATLGAAACQGSDAGSAPRSELDGAADSGTPDGPRAAYRAEVVRELSVERDGRSFPVELVRVIRPDGGRTYVHWIRSDRPAPTPAVLATDPYGGIDWSGEEVDARWAGRSKGVYDDVEQPDYDGETKVNYEPASIAQVNDEAYIHLLNGFAVLRVHGRFYAGGSVADDIEDMKAGMWFLAEQPDVDHSRVGVFGGSWGGFESLYASAFGDRRIAPLVTVALYPPADFSEWLPYAASRAEPVLSALRGHRHRVEATTGPMATADYTGLTFADLCPGLPSATLLLHDSLDNLVPIRQSERLSALCGADVIYWRRPGTPDPGAATHGPLLEEEGYPSAYTYGVAYLHRRLAPGATLIGAVSPSALVAHLTTVRDAQVRGEDVGFAAPRLRELTDPKMMLIEVKTGQMKGGAEIVAAAVDVVWGTSYTAAEIDAVLSVGLPPP